MVFIKSNLFDYKAMEEKKIFTWNSLDIKGQLINTVASPHGLNYNCWERHLGNITLRFHLEPEELEVAHCLRFAQVFSVWSISFTHMCISTNFHSECQSYADIIGTNTGKLMRLKKISAFCKAGLNIWVMFHSKSTLCFLQNKSEHWSFFQCPCLWYIWYKHNQWFGSLL